MTSEPIAILLGHNRWANRCILELCAQLSEEQFHRRFEIGPGSLHDTTTHIVGCILRWTDRIAQVQLRPSIEDAPPPRPGDKMPRRSAPELLALHDQTCAEFAAVVNRLRATDTGLATPITLRFSRETFVFPLSTLILHVTNHGMHHRAQCMNMLRHSGVPINHDYDEMEWQLAGEP